MSEPTVPDDEILATVSDAYQSHETDTLGGGVPPAVVYERLEADLSYPQLCGRLQSLAETGRLERVCGQDPETHRPRWSYRPVNVSLSE